MTYLAIADGNGAIVERETLLTALKDSHPDVRPRLTFAEGDTRDVAWSYIGVGGPTDIYTLQNRACLCIDGSLEDAAPLAVWYRTLVPGDVRVIFCDESYTFDVPITVGMRPAELIASVVALIG